MVHGTDVVIRDRLTNRSAEPVKLTWTHTRGSGGDLLTGPVTVDTNARTARLDDRAPVVGAPAAPGDPRFVAHVVQAEQLEPAVGGRFPQRPVRPGSLRDPGREGEPAISSARGVPKALPGCAALPSSATWEFSLAASAAARRRATCGRLSAAGVAVHV